MPFAMLLLLGLLLWGLGRVPREGTEDEMLEIENDDPSIEPIPCVLPLAHLGGSVVEDRRLLASTWGPDTPDLLVAYWAGVDEEHPRTTIFQQFFLPLSPDIGDALAYLENSFFEGAMDQGVPERSRLLTAYCFIRLPGGQDLVIESNFLYSEFQHQFYLMDSEGKLARLRAEKETIVTGLLGRDWLMYRSAVAGIGSMEFVSPTEESFSGFLEDQALQSHAHAWIAHLLGAENPEQGELRRHLSFALELGPNNVIARIERARLKGLAGLKTVTNGLREHAATQSDRPAQAGFLLAQSLLCLHQTAGARSLCETLLLEWPHHEGISRLLHLIDQWERGAQT